MSGDVRSEVSVVSCVYFDFFAYCLNVQKQKEYSLG